MKETAHGVIIESEKCSEGVLDEELVTREQWRHH